jgi:SAM-dependent methyltransferase
VSEPKKVNYDGRLHTVYRSGRALPANVIRTWMQTLAEYVPCARPVTVLDLGSGTGRLSPALAEEFGGPVYGVEPSAGMLDQARQHSAHPAVAYLKGAAEHIPLSDASCDLAVLFLSWHHVTDKPAGAAELARVLRPGGAMFVRGTFGDRVPHVDWHRFFPEARAIEERIFPRLDDTVDLFAAAGFEEVAYRRVELRRVESMSAWAERLRTRSISTFEHMSSDQIEAGFARVDHAVAEHEQDIEIVDGADLLVLRRGA